VRGQLPFGSLSGLAFCSASLADISEAGRAKKIKKPLDKPPTVWYNKDTKKERK